MKAKIAAPVLLIISFLLGIVGGIYLDRTFLQSHRPWDSARRERPREKMSNYLARELKLTEAQQKEIETILEQRRPRFNRIHHSMNEQFEAEIDTVREEIRRLLTADQKQRYDQMIEKERQEREQWRKKAGLPDSGDVQQ